MDETTRRTDDKLGEPDIIIVICRESHVPCALTTRVTFRYGEYDRFGVIKVEDGAIQLYSYPHAHDPEDYIVHRFIVDPNGRRRDVFFERDRADAFYELARNLENILDESS